MKQGCRITQGQQFHHQRYNVSGQGILEPFLILAMAIFRYVDRDCTDVRDQVYGLLGLVNL